MAGVHRCFICTKTLFSVEPSSEASTIYLTLILLAPDDDHFYLDVSEASTKHALSLPLAPLAKLAIHSCAFACVI